MKSKTQWLVGALLVSAGFCTPSYSFEWLDRMLGIDLDGSESVPAYSQYPPGYAAPTYSNTGSVYYRRAQVYPQVAPTYSSHVAAYPPSSVTYTAPANSAAPMAATTVPGTHQHGWSYPPANGGYQVQPGPHTAHQPVPVTTYQQVIGYDAYGNRVITQRPVVSYQVGQPMPQQGRTQPSATTQPVYGAPATYGATPTHGAPATYGAPSTYGAPPTGAVGR